MNLILIKCDRVNYQNIYSILYLDAKTPEDAEIQFNDMVYYETYISAMFWDDDTMSYGAYVNTKAEVKAKYALLEYLKENKEYSGNYKDFIERVG